MSYYDNQEAKVKISIELEKRGWKIFGFREDQSDSMTDYWCPASWSAGIATKNGYVLVIDNHNTHYSGYEVKKYDYSKQQSKYKSNARIDKLTAMMNDSASTENEKTSCATLIEKELEKLGVTSEPSYTVVETYPTFAHGNPKSCTWHIEFNNQIIAKGKGVFSANDYDWENKEVSREQQKADNMNKFINRIESAIKQDSALESEVIKVAKTSIKPVQKADKAINVGDILSFSYHGHFWIVANIYTVGEQVRVTYELLGSEKRGYQRLSGMNVKRYYQVLNRLQKEMAEGKVKVYTLQEVTEYEEKTVYKKTAKKQPKANFEVNAIAGDVAEVTEEVKAEQVKKEATTSNVKNDGQSVTISFNKEKNGIEIKFTSKPSANVIASLKENGFRWFQPLGFWCAKQTPERLEFAQSLCNNTTEEQPTEEQQTAPEAHSTTEVNPDELMVEILADSLTSYIIACGKPQTDEEKEKANKHILGYMVSREMEPTEGMLSYMQTEYPFLYAIVTHNSSVKTEPTQTGKDPYTFNVDSAFTYHDIHFKSWNMEVSEVEEFLTAYDIPFYISYDKFICQGLTLDQVATVEEINKLNAAIIFYDNKYNENVESVNNSRTPEEPQTTLTPFEYGVRAFERGISCAPALDNEFLETHIKGLKVGEGGAELMKEWLAGWTKANLDAPVDYEKVYNREAAQEQQEPDNVVYHDFGNITAVQEEEEEKEINTNIFDDILSKFENIEVTADSKIAADDLEFCKEQESIYKDLISTYNSFYKKLQDIGEISKDHGQKFGRQSETHFHEQHTAHYRSMGKWDYEKAIREMKESFILYVCSYFMKKYNVTIDYSRIQSKYNESVTYEQIIDEIYISLDGFNFTEKAVQEIKEKAKNTVRHDKITIKNAKLIIDGRFAYLDRWDGYRLNGGYGELLKALQHFENGSTEGNTELTNKYVGYSNERNQANYERYEPTTLSKVASIKFLKNGKLEIEFKSNQQAAKFAHEYCGYKQQTA